MHGGVTEREGWPRRRRLVPQSPAQLPPRPGHSRVFLPLCAPPPRHFPLRKHKIGLFPFLGEAASRHLPVIKHFRREATAAEVFPEARLA